MIKAELQFAQLLPIDGEVQWHGVESYREQLERGEELDPLLTLPFPDDESEKHIVLDGHHKGRAALISGRIAVEAQVFTDDAELLTYLKRERYWWHYTETDTRESIRNLYRGTWAPRMAQRGIVSFGDVPEVVHEPTSWKRPDDYRSVRVDRDGQRL